AAQDHRVQHFCVGEVVGELAAAGEEAQILEPLDRAADEGVGGAAGCRGGHMTIVASRLISARATLSAASADVLGLLRDGLPCSWMAKRPAAPSASISCTLPGASGSATSSTSVLSKPRPASATAAATLAFCGERSAPSAAAPAYQRAR